MNSCPPVPLRRWALYASRSIASGVDGAGGRSRPAALGPRRRGSSSLKRPYGTKVSFTFAIDEGGAVNPKLAPYIQSSLTRTDRNAVRTGSPSDHTLLPSTGFAVSFLGTGSGGVQSVDRLSSVAALRLGGQAFLFDAGEGAQRYLANSRIGARDITKIFLTHLHGDHTYGLAGVLLMIHDVTRASVQAALEKGKGGGGGSGVDRPVVEVYGPAGTYNFIAMTLALSCTKLRFITVVVHELMGGEHDGGPKRPSYKARGRGGGVNGNVFLSKYDEVSSPGLIRKEIRRNRDGHWVIERPGRPAEGSGTPHASSETGLREYNITAGEVVHLPGVQTFGYVVEEQTPARNIDPDRARALGVNPGPKYRKLKQGFAVESDDGTTVVCPEDVLLKVVEPRKFAIIGDNCSVPSEMAELCRDAHVLVHEATVVDKDDSEARTRGHATASMAGSFAKEVGAKALLLNHIGAARNSIGNKDILVDAIAANQSVSEVQIACDFMEVAVPKRGFSF